MEGQRENGNIKRRLLTVIAIMGNLRRKEEQDEEEADDEELKRVEKQIRGKKQCNIEEYEML